MRVAVYRNLNAPGVQFSIAIARGPRTMGRVIGREKIVFLKNCTFRHATQRQIERVRAGVRTVCNWVVGDLTQPWEAGELENRLEAGENWKRVYADPKKTDFFIDATTGKKIDQAAWVMVNSEGCFYLE